MQPRPSELSGRSVRPKSPRGYLLPYFVSDAERMEYVSEDPYILMHDEKISNMTDLLPILEQVARAGRPLLVIAEEVQREALATLAVNNLLDTLSTADSMSYACLRMPACGAG